jgi:hypothetical protein
MGGPAPEELAIGANLSPSPCPSFHGFAECGVIEITKFAITKYAESV